MTGVQTCALRSSFVEGLRNAAKVEILEDNLSFMAESRRIVSGTLHDMMLELAPDGAFPGVALPDEEETRPVLEGTMVERLVVLRDASPEGLHELAARVTSMRRFAPGVACSTVRSRPRPSRSARTPAKPSTW